MNVTGFIQKVLDSQRKIRAGYDKMLEGLPEGKLEAFAVKGQIYYRRKINGRREYVGSESEPIVSQLKLRAFLEEAIEILRINEDAPDPESVIKVLPPACLPRQKSRKPAAFSGPPVFL